MTVGEHTINRTPNMVILEHKWKHHIEVNYIV